MQLVAPPDSSALLLSNDLFKQSIEVNEEQDAGDEEAEEKLEDDESDDEADTSKPLLILIGDTFLLAADPMLTWLALVAGTMWFMRCK